MKSIEQLYDRAVLQRRSISNALVSDQEQREPLTARQKRDEVIALMGIMLNSARADKREFSAQENSDWNSLERQADDLQREISLDRARLDRAAEAHFGGAAATNSRPTEGWYDATTGKRVQVLAPHEKLSDGRRDADAPRVSFGDAIRGMALGTRDPDVRASLSEGSDASGGYTVPTHLLSEIIDRMRARTTVIAAGARTVILDTERTVIARLASDPTASWRLENTDITESDPSFESVEFVARSLAVLVKISRELLEDSVNVEDSLMTAFAASMALETDRVSLLGSGTPPEPRGIFNTTGIGSLSMGTNGATLIGYDEFIDLLYELESNNAPPPSAFILHPRSKATLAKLRAQDEQPLRKPEVLDEVPMLSTTQVPIDQTQGTATDASCVIAGDFSQLLFGVRSSLRIELLREAFATKMQYGFVAHLRMDVQLAHPQAFAVLKGIIPAP